MNSKLNSILHSLLCTTGMISQKPHLVSGYTGGRTESSREMTDIEARELIKYLQELRHKQEKGCDSQRKKLIALSYSIGHDAVFVKKWCEKYGVNGVRKTFNQYDKKELLLLIEKFNKTVINHRINNYTEE